MDEASPGPGQIHIPNPSRNVDPIPIWTAWWRKLITIRAVSDEESGKPLSQQEFIARMSAIQSKAAQTTDMGVKTASFWKMEKLAASFFKQAQSGNTLSDPRLPVEIRPIAHCGMGIGAVEAANFDPFKITSAIESFSHPQYRLFAYEGSGAMLALYELDMFGIVARSFSLLGLVPLAPLHRPAGEKFVTFFPAEIQRLIAHGYGRLLYFKNNNIAGAIRDATRPRWLDTSACVQGIAFAYAMVNNDDLDRVLQAGRGLDDPELKRSFENGLIYALEFWEWMAPGFLSLLRPATAYHADMIRIAQEEIDSVRARGVLGAFIVERAAERRATRY